MSHTGGVSEHPQPDSHSGSSTWWNWLLQEGQRQPQEALLL